MAAEPRDEDAVDINAVEARAKLALERSIVPHFADPDGSRWFLYEPDHRSLFRYFEHYAKTIFIAHIEQKFRPYSRQQRVQMRDQLIESLVAQILPDNDKPLPLEHRSTVAKNVNAGPIDSIHRDGLLYRKVEPSGDWEDILQQCWSQIRVRYGTGGVGHFGVLWDGGYRSKLRDPDEAEYFRDRIRSLLRVAANEWESGQARPTVRQAGKDEISATEQANLSEIEQAVYDIVGEDNFWNLTNRQIWDCFRKELLKYKERRTRFGQTPKLNEALRSCLRRIRKKKGLPESSKIKKN